MEKIEGKVAKILDEYSIVINVGRNNGVVDGMVFAIFVQSDEEIKDPDSGEVISPLNEKVVSDIAIFHFNGVADISSITLVNWPQNDYLLGNLVDDIVDVCWRLVAPEAGILDIRDRGARQLIQWHGVPWERGTGAERKGGYCDKGDAHWLLRKISR